MHPWPRLAADSVKLPIRERGNSLDFPFSHIAVCGDLTQSAREAEFQAARDFLGDLPAPTLIVPGNHDLPGWRVWSRFARPWAGVAAAYGN